jgi:hypothetical protein
LVSAEGTIKDVGNGSLAEKATCANCGKSITKGVAQRTTGWVHQSGSKWCPSGATVAYREASLQTTASWVDAARSVVTNKQAQTVDGILLDLFSASTMLGVYDALNPDNKAKFEAMPLAQAQSMAFRLVEKTSAARVAEGDAAPFVGEAAGEGVREAFTRNDYGFPQDAAPRPPKPSSPTAGDMPGSVTYTSDPAQRPDYYGLGVPADQRKDRTPKDTAPVDGTRTAGDKRADELARMTERSNELAERHRQERDDDRESRERHRQYWDQHPTSTTPTSRTTRTSPRWSTRSCRCSPRPTRTRPRATPTSRRRSRRAPPTTSSTARSTRPRRCSTCR